MNEIYEYLWTTEINNYILLRSKESSYLIFNITTNNELIIENNESYEFVIKKMLQSNVRIVRVELAKYLLEKRPIPHIIGCRCGKEIYRCPDSGEKFELDMEYSAEYETEYDVGIKWSKYIPLTKQILYLKKIHSGISISTPDLLNIAKNGKEYIFVEYCGFGEANEIRGECKKLGLDIYIIAR